MCGNLQLHWRRLDGWRQRCQAWQGHGGEHSRRGIPETKGVRSMSCARKAWWDYAVGDGLLSGPDAPRSFRSGGGLRNSKLRQYFFRLPFLSSFQRANPLTHMLGAQPFTQCARHSFAPSSASHHLSFSFPSSRAPGASGIASGRGESSPDLHLVHHVNPLHRLFMDRMYTMNKMVSRQLAAWQRKHAR